MSKEEKNQAEEEYRCPEGQTGILRLQHLTYFMQMAGEYIAVPEFPAWVCDVCKLREYDHRALSWLNVLLDPQTGRSVTSPKHSRSRSDESPPAPISE